MTVRAGLVLAFATIGCAADAVDPAVPGTGPLYRTDGRHVRDRHGRAIVLRGINYPSDDVAHWKGLPPDSDLRDLAFIAESGFDAVRLVINWDRIEPAPDRYDEEYVALVARHARLAWEQGLYVVIDLHQDLFGMGFGLHGAPRWACDEAAYAAFEPTSPWFFNYFSAEVSSCFDRFWKSPDLQRHHRTAARRVAEAVADNEGVIGFDPHNEPFPGTIPFEEFERDFLWPFHQAFAAEVGGALPGRLLFFEPSVLFNVQQATSFPSPAPGVAPLQAVFFPHYYNVTVEAGLLWDGNAEADATWAAAAGAEAARAGVPWGLGEMGGAMETPNLDAFLASFYAMLDSAQAASFLWIFARGSGGFGVVDEATGSWHPHASAFLRPAPAAIAGTPVRFGWDPATRVLDLAWDEDPAAGATEVIVPAWVARVGYDLVVDGAPAAPVPAAVPGRIAIAGGKGGQRSLRLEARGPYPAAP